MSKDLKARARIALFTDEASFVEIGALVEKRSTDFESSIPASSGDGVITGYAAIGGKPVFIYSQDASVLGGTVGEMHAKKILHLYEMAMKTGAPVIGLLDSKGLRLEEVTDALYGFGALFRMKAKASGVIPQISVVFGQCGGGMAVLAGLSDFVFMESGASFFLNAPNTLLGNTKEKLDSSSAAYQTLVTGNVTASGSETELAGMVRALISVLPSNNRESAIRESDGDLNRLTPELTGVHDPRYIANQLSDDYSYLEVKKDYAPDMTTGFILLDGVTCGFIGNADPECTAAGLEKAAGFVSFCDAFELPIVTVTDASGFKATAEEEARLVKSASGLAAAFSAATTPKIGLVLNAAGSAPVLMNSKALGADIVYALEDAKIAVMDARSAAKILGGDDLSAVAERFDEKQSAIFAARRGYVDEIISASGMRKHVLAALEMLYSKRESGVSRKHASK